jgi:hypothetical protein
MKENNERSDDGPIFKVLHTLMTPSTKFNDERDLRENICNVYKGQVQITNYSK